MKITIAKTAGFCMGVRRAVDLALESANKQTPPIYTYGPLIHNPQVLELLAEKGVGVLDTIPPNGTGTVIVRAHGVPPEAKAKLKTAGFKVVDATCPRVIKVQTIIRKHARLGNATIIIGDENHPEVVGLLGYAGEQRFVVGSMADLKALPNLEKAIIVAQTTQNTTFFNSVKDWVQTHHPHYMVFDTICDSTQKRQDEITSLAKTADAVVVVGGHNSGNTQRLAELARQGGVSAFHVETEAELNPEALSNAHHIAITAGASTPNWITKRVFRTIETMPSRAGSQFNRLIFKLQRAALLTNIYVSLGAGCLCYACNRLQGIDAQFPYVLIAMLYVLSMHLLNNLTGRKIDKYKDAHQAAFYYKHQLYLTILAIGAGAAGLITAAFVGRIPFLILLGMSMTGLLYNTRLVPPRIADMKYRSIRDIPGSKTVLITLGWGVVTILFPALAENGSVSFRTLLVFCWGGGMVFVRSAFFDLLDMQGDRIVGKETIPILLGEQRTRMVLKATLCVLFLMLQAAAAFGWVHHVGYALAVCPVLLYIVLIANETGKMLPGIRLEFLVESHFVTAGGITAFFSAVG